MNALSLLGNDFKGRLEAVELGAIAPRSPDWTPL